MVIKLLTDPDPSSIHVNGNSLILCINLTGPGVQAYKAPLIHTLGSSLEVKKKSVFVVLFHLKEK